MICKYYAILYETGASTDLVSTGVLEPIPPTPADTEEGPY